MPALNPNTSMIKYPIKQICTYNKDYDLIRYEEYMGNELVYFENYTYHPNGKIHMIVDSNNYQRIHNEQGELKVQYNRPNYGFKDTSFVIDIENMKNWFKPHIGVFEVVDLEQSINRAARKIPKISISKLFND